MKRSRVEELPYACRTAGVAGGGGNISTGTTSVPVPVTVPGHHRILSQHTGSIQYQINTSPVTGVLKNTSVENIVAVTVAGSVQTQAPVQYSGMLSVFLSFKISIIWFFLFSL